MHSAITTKLSGTPQKSQLLSTKIISVHIFKYLCVHQYFVQIIMINKCFTFRIYSENNVACGNYLVTSPQSEQSSQDLRIEMHLNDLCVQESEKSIFYNQRNHIS